MATSTYPMTLEEMECLPDDGHRRELIQGSLREKEQRWHDRRHGEAVIFSKTRIASNEYS